MKRLTTDLLEITYRDEGHERGRIALLLHGWPDDPGGLSRLAENLHRQGYRTITPWLRGFGPTTFRHETTVRDGRGVALAEDAIALMDALDFDRFVVIGHDWGGRAGYHLAALYPARLTCLVTLGIGYSPFGRFDVPAFDQAQLWWYQWLMTTEGGAQAVRDDPVGFARRQWETWSPEGWFSEADFLDTARSFENPDWPAITLHAYRSRWRPELVDIRYDEAQTRIEATGALQVPTLMVIGEEDRADYPESSAGAERWFPLGLRRVILPGVGHFPAREAPEAVAQEIQGFASGLS